MDFKKVLENDNKNQVRKRKKKKKRFYRSLFGLNENISTAIVLLIVLLALFFLYLVAGTFDLDKDWAGIEQNADLALPGKKIN